METLESLVTSPDVEGMIEAAAARAGIQGGVAYLTGEDVLSELREVAIEAASDYDPTIAKFTTYIWPRLLGKAVDLRRRHGRQYRTSNPRPVETSLDEAEAMSCELEPCELRLDIQTMVCRLPLRERLAFVMKEIGGEPLEVLSMVLKANKTTAASCRMAAVRRLRIGLR